MHNGKKPDYHYGRLLIALLLISVGYALTYGPSWPASVSSVTAQMDAAVIDMNFIALTMGMPRPVADYVIAGMYTAMPLLMIWAAIQWCRGRGSYATK